MSTALLLLALATAAQDDPSLLTGPLPRPAMSPVFDLPEHALGHPTPRPEFVPGAPRWSAPEAPESLEQVRRIGAPDPGDAPTPLVSGRLAIRERMTAPLVTEPGDGHVWVRGRDYRASFGEAGFTFLPVFGKASPQEFPVQFVLERVTVGGEALPVGVQAVRHGEGHVTLAHPAVREVYHLDLDFVEQTFELDEVPPHGDLVVELGVASELPVLERADGLHFVHPTLGHVTYGDAFVLDAAGARQAISRVWTGDGIALRVPAEFLAGAVMPVTIDPRVSAWVNGFGLNDDRFPDLCYDGRQDRYWVAWQEYTSATNSDCYVTSFTASGVQGASYAIETTSDDWSEPRVAFHYGSNRLLVVAAEREALTADGSVKGQLFNPSSGALIGTELLISGCCLPKQYPDVGGNTFDSVVNAHFCVVWAVETLAGHHDVQYRVVDWDGSFVTNVLTVENSAADTIHTTISASHGDSAPIGDYWTIAWTRDEDFDEVGAIEARRVRWDGSTNFGAGNFVVDPATNCSWPSVSSRLDEPLVANGDRPSIVVYERDFASATGPGGVQASIYGRVVTDGQAFAPNAISLTMEDVDGELDQRRGQVATDGSSWYLVYGEVHWNQPAGSNYDAYYCSGSVSQSPFNAHLALAERHQRLSSSGTPELFGRVATVWDGESSSVSDDAAAIWVDLDGANGGTLEGYSLEIPTFAAGYTAVGRQYCAANDNGGPGVNHAHNSWMWIEGNQALTTAHVARCENVTPNATGYLLASRTQTSVNLAGGSAGRLCVQGAGRYVNAVQGSGPSGAFSTTIDPLSIPSPVGFIAAAAGETWNFQYWHRDSLNGVATSNFSNACTFVFRN